VEFRNGAFLWKAIQLLLADIRATYTSSEELWIALSSLKTR
jgi:hypothetical protein